MSLRLGDTAPDFTQESTEGPIHFYDYVGDSWALLFSHPRDFTPVCTTELGSLGARLDEFKKRGVKVIGLSIDPLEDHKKWVSDIEETQGSSCNFPILADADRRVAVAYDMIHPNADNVFTVRSVFIIDPAKKVRLIQTYPASTGRNVDELLRVIDALQLADKHKVVTPANWKDGDDVIIAPSVSDEEAKKQFPKGWVTHKPYLRTTPQPDK